MPPASAGAVRQKLELRAMAWLARREYTRAELSRRLLQYLREQHRKAGLVLHAGDRPRDAARRHGQGPDPGQAQRRGQGAAGRRDRLAEQAAALADEFAPAPALPSAGGHARGNGVLAADRNDWADADPHAVDHDSAPGFDAGGAQADVDALLDRFEAQQLLSDARAAGMIVDARKSRRGLMRIQQELAQRGVPAEQAHAALDGLREQQVPLAREVWRKRFGSPPRDAAERQKQTRFLASRGFSFAVIRQVLDLDEDVPD